MKSLRKSALGFNCWLLVILQLLSSVLATNTTNSSKADTAKADPLLLEPDTVKEYSKVFDDDSKVVPFSNAMDCVPERTKNHQAWLFTMYRGAWEYRKTFHPYGKFAHEGDLKDTNAFTGSVIMLNFQDHNMRLNCPCAGSVKEWRMYGRHAAKFNERKTKNKELIVRAPAQRHYYRTFSCKTEYEGEEYIHYFNVFTRPLGLTSLPPLMFVEGIGGPSDSKKQIDCHMTMVYNPDQRAVNKQRYGYIAAPFQYYWMFPPQNEKDKSKYTINHEKHSRPDIDDGVNENLFWGNNNDPDKDGGEIGPHDPDKKTNIKLEDEEPIAFKDVCQLNSETVNDTYQFKHERTIEKLRFGTRLKITSDYAERIQAGTYACVVVDGNGLSSAFWWDGDSPPDVAKFRGTSRIRVRSLFWVFVALGVFCGFIPIIILMILLPDNKEDFEDGELESAEHAENRTGAPSRANSVEMSTHASTDTDASATARKKIRKKRKKKRKIGSRSNKVNPTNSSKGTSPTPSRSQSLKKAKLDTNTN